MTWDPTKPVTGNPTTQSVRDNFAALDTALKPLLIGAAMTNFGGSIVQQANAAAVIALLGINVNLGLITPSRILGNTLSTPSSVQEIALAAPLQFFPGGTPSLGFRTIAPSMVFGNPLTIGAQGQDVGFLSPLLFVGTNLRIASLGIDNSLLGAMPARTLKGNDTAGSNSAKDVVSSQIPGTVTNDAANVGNIGQFISSTVLIGAAIPVGSGAATDITTIQLTAGDWDVWGNVFSNPAAGTTTTFFNGWISTVANTQPAIPNSGAFAASSGSLGAGVSEGFPVGMIRLSLAATTTVSLGVSITFGVNTMSAYGFIGARRRR